MTVFHRFTASLPNRFTISPALRAGGPRSQEFEICTELGDVMAMTAEELQTLIEDATADYALGEMDAALAKLARATAAAPDSFEAWHALAEVNFSARRLDEALAAAERAHALKPQDLFINTTLSRIWMERGDKARAEHFGAQARIGSWRDQLKDPGS